MLEFRLENDLINIKYSGKEKISINTTNNNISIGDFLIDFPWEYEKSWVLVEVKEYNNELFYSLVVDSKTLLVVFKDNFELKEEILSFFWDIDFLIIKWSKESAKIVDNIEAKAIIPFWDWVDVFLNTKWKTLEWEKVFKLKWDLDDTTTTYIKLI